MKVLFISNLNFYTEAYAYFVALRQCGFYCHPLSTQHIPHYPGITTNDSFTGKVKRRLKAKFLKDPLNINKKTLALQKHYNFDVIWSCKAYELSPQTLATLKHDYPNTKLIFSSGDNVAKSPFNCQDFLNSIHHFDCVYTMKSQTQEQLKQLGAKHTHYIAKSYSKTWQLQAPQQHPKYGVTFVGSFEKERSDDMAYLAQHGIQVDIWGNGWHRFAAETPNIVVHGHPMYDMDMFNLINNSKINLCFLRKLAEDLHTNRTFEIPAAGGFMMGERTQEQQDFFTEGSEAEYFDSKEELLDKVKTYLADDTARYTVAKQGQDRCFNAPYSTNDRVMEIMNHVKTL